MFTVDTQFNFLAVRREKVLVLMQSINALSVKVPGLPAQPAVAYITGWDVGDGRACALIYLYYAESHRSATYVHEPRVFSMVDLPQVTQEAVEFLEAMGFMLDDAAYGTLRPEEQVALIERTPVFHKNLDEFAVARGEELPEVELDELAEEEAEAVPTEKAQAIGRLLMSF